MKKLMMIAAMMIAAVSANAQNEVGQITLKPTVGMNIATMTKMTDSKVRIGLIAGVEAEYGVAENFGISAGVLYSMQGVKFKDREDGVTATETYKLDYINIPILAQFYPMKGLALKAGIQPGFKVSAKQSLKATSGSTTLTDSEKLDGVKGFQFAIPVGISYEYASFVLDARYNIYLTKALKSEFESNSRHSVFSITLGYKFAL
jgi:hypothetical protein